MKGNRQGSLSRSISQVFRTFFKVRKTARAWQKHFLTRSAASLHTNIYDTGRASTASSIPKPIAEAFVRRLDHVGVGLRTTRCVLPKAHIRRQMPSYFAVGRAALSPPLTD